MRRAHRSAIGIFAAAAIGLLVACESKVSEENFDRITDGMSYSAVSDILGSGEEQVAEGGFGISGGGVLGGSQPKVSNMKTYLWREKGHEITVTFVDDKVIQKANAGF